MNTTTRGMCGMRGGVTRPPIRDTQRTNIIVNTPINTPIIPLIRTESCQLQAFFGMERAVLQSAIQYMCIYTIYIDIICIGLYLYRLQIHSILMEFFKASNCTEESRKDETCLQFKMNK